MWLLLACVVEPAHPPPGESRADGVWVGSHGPLTRHGAAPPAALRRAGPPGGPPAETVVGRLLPDLEGATWDADRGAALDDALAALDPERAALGLAGLTYDTFAATCEDPRILWSDGVHEAALDVPWGFLMTAPPARDRYALDAACTDALDTLGPAGAVGAGCDAADERAFFAEGSACRDCLADADWAECRAAEACPAEATRQAKLGSRWYGMARADTLLCAPGHLGTTWGMVADLDEDADLPDPWDHGGWDAWCLAFWFDGGTDLYCITDSPALAHGDALVSGLAWVREIGDDRTPQAGRASVIDSVEVDGVTFHTTWLTSSGVVAVSAPPSLTPDGWGLDPRALRPDGTDPADPDHTQAREYVAALAMKVASSRDGVPVAPSNHNRCTSWTGPYADGSSACEAPGAWSTDGWLDDGMVSWWDARAGEIYSFPLVTLASTGLPDPAIPGGLVPRVLSSTTLADPDWEGCAWGETFVPDQMRVLDTAPAGSDTPYAVHDGQTFRQGRPDDPGVRLWLATNQRREFCPEPL